MPKKQPVKKAKAQMDEHELQQKSEHIVRNEVFHVLTMLAERCFQEGIFNYDEIQNYYTFPEYIGDYAKFYGGSEYAKISEVDRLEKMFGHFEAEGNTEAAESVRAEIEKIENLESEPQEIFEWWIVSDWLKDELLKRGEPILESDEYWLNLWGRTTSGQAISMDGVIRQIMKDLHGDVSKMESGGSVPNTADNEALDDIAWDIAIEHKFIEGDKWKSDDMKKKAYKMAELELIKEKGGKVTGVKGTGIDLLITGRL